MDWSKAISKLEQANAAVLDCAVGDLARLEAGIVARDAAVREISALDARALAPGLAARLSAAFDKGVAVRAKLAAIYRELDAELRRTSRIRTFFEAHGDTR